MIAAIRLVCTWSIIFENWCDQKILKFHTYGQNEFETKTELLQGFVCFNFFDVLCNLVINKFCKLMRTKNSTFVAKMNLKPWFKFRKDLFGCLRFIYTIRLVYIWSIIFSSWCDPNIPKLYIIQIKADVLRIFIWLLASFMQSFDQSPWSMIFANWWELKI